jgi:hypothetical protein
MTNDDNDENPPIEYSGQPGDAALRRLAEELGEDPDYVISMTRKNRLTELLAGRTITIKTPRLEDDDAVSAIPTWVQEWLVDRDSHRAQRILEEKRIGDD